MKKLIVCLILFFSFAPAQAAQWQLDTGHSAVMFGIKHIFSQVRGQFTDMELDMEFDPENADKGQIAFTVKVASINTFIAKRDQHLRSPDFFDAAKYPTLSFISTSIQPLGNRQYQVNGLLTVKEITRELSVVLVYLGQKSNPFNPDQQVGGFETRFEINRLDYGVGNGKFYDMGVVDKTVEVLVSVEVFKID